MAMEAARERPPERTLPRHRLSQCEESRYLLRQIYFGHCLISLLWILNAPCSRCLLPKLPKRIFLGYQSYWYWRRLNSLRVIYYTLLLSYLSQKSNVWKTRGSVDGAGVIYTFCTILGDFAWRLSRSYMRAHLQLYNDFAYMIIIDNIVIENSTPACWHPQIESQQVQT